MSIDTETPTSSTHPLATQDVGDIDFPDLPPIDFRTLPVIRAGHDLDGCYWSFRDGYAASLARRFPAEAARYNDFVPSEHWEFFRGLNQTVEEFIEHYTWAMGSDFFSDLTHTIPGSVEAVKSLTERLGKRVEHNIVTDRSVGGPFAGAHQTAVWAASVAFPFKSIRIDADKASMPNHVFVDDRFENYVALRKAGIRAYLNTQPWNVDYDVPQGHRVDSVAEYCERIHHAATVSGFMP